MKTLGMCDLRVEAKLTPQSAELALRLREPLDGDFIWTGRLRGPFCAGRQTLVANYPIRTQRASNEGVVTLPDFCHWSSASPFTYQLELDLKRGEESIASLRETMAIHWGYVHQGKLYQAGKRWVPRMARLRLPAMETEKEISDLKDWLTGVRESELVLVARDEDASEALLRECLALGVWVAIEADELRVSNLAKWESFACVCWVLNAEGMPSSGESSSLLVASREGLQESIRAEVWSFARSGAKLIVRSGDYGTPQAAREACDTLQADAAALGEWAGYLV